MSNASDTSGRLQRFEFIKRFTRTTAHTPVVYAKSRSNGAKVSNFIRRCTTNTRHTSVWPVAKGHSGLHSGEIPFKCSASGKQFRHSTNLRSHQLRMHQGTPYEGRCNLVTEESNGDALHHIICFVGSTINIFTRQ